MNDELADLVVEISAIEEDERRRARVRSLSDEQLTRAFALLSDARVVLPSEVLALIEEEVRARGIPAGRTH